MSAYGRGDVSDHEWMVELVKAAEELGYLVRYVGPSEIGLTGPRNSSAGYVDITIKDTILDAQTLRLVLQPTSKVVA